MFKKEVDCFNYYNSKVPGYKPFSGIGLKNVKKVF